MSRAILYKQIIKLIDDVSIYFYGKKDISILIAQYISDFVIHFAQPRPIIYPNLVSQLSKTWLKSIKTKKYNIIFAVDPISSYLYIASIKTSSWKFQWDHQYNLVSETQYQKHNMKVYEHKKPYWDIDQDSFKCKELPIILDEAICVVEYENSVFQSLFPT